MVPALITLLRSRDLNSFRFSGTGLLGAILQSADDPQFFYELVGVYDYEGARDYLSIISDNAMFPNDTVSTVLNNADEPFAIFSDRGDVIYDNNGVNLRNALKSVLRRDPVYPNSYTATYIKLKPELFSRPGSKLFTLQIQILLKGTQVSKIVVLGPRVSNPNFDELMELNTKLVNDVSENNLGWCDRVRTTCVGEDDPFENDAHCERYWASLPNADERCLYHAETDTYPGAQCETKLCKIAHLGSARRRPWMHCPHLGPNGGPDPDGKYKCTADTIAAGYADFLNDPDIRPRIPLARVQAWWDRYLDKTIQ